MSKRIFTIFILILGFTATTFAAGGHEHGTAAKMADDHAGMAMGEGMIMVGSQVSKGVKGMAHLNDVREAMLKAGMNHTHHFMIAFADEKTGVQLEQGTVALKITDPNGKVMETVELVGMSGHFGADIVLDIQGEYHFKIGTKLADGENRKYHFHYVVK